MGWPGLARRGSHIYSLAFPAHPSWHDKYVVSILWFSLIFSVMVPRGSSSQVVMDSLRYWLCLSCGSTFRHHSPCSSIVDMCLYNYKCLNQWKNKGGGIALGGVTACTFQQGECIPGLNTVEVNAYIALNLLLVLNPCSRNVFLVPIAIYICELMWIGSNNKGIKLR